MSALAASSPELPGDPHEILATALCPIGDTLFLTPALALLRRRFPQARITLAAAAANQGVLAGNPDVDHLIIVQDPAVGFHPWRLLTGARQLGQSRPDIVINFSAGGAIVAWLAGLRAPRLGLQMPPWWALVGARDDRVYRQRHAVDHYLKAIEPLVQAPDNPVDRVPRFYLADEDRAKARALLAADDAGASGVVITLHVGGEGFQGRKRWAPERFAQVANALVERFNARVVIVGGKVDIPMSDATAALVRGPISMLAGKTNLKVTGALIEASALFIGNDSSPLHIAAAVGTPAIGIYGPSDWQEFSPVGRPGYHGRALHSTLACSPCFRFVGNAPLWEVNTCHTYACLNAIAAPRVLDAAIELLSGGASTSRDATSAR